MFDSTNETPTSYYSKNAGKINTTVGLQLLKHGASLPAFPVIFISSLSLVKREMYNNMIVVWKYLQCYKVVLKWVCQWIHWLFVQWLIRSNGDHWKENEFQNEMCCQCEVVDVCMIMYRIQEKNLLLLILFAMLMEVCLQECMW